MQGKYSYLCNETSTCRKQDNIQTSTSKQKIDLIFCGGKSVQIIKAAGWIVCWGADRRQASNNFYWAKRGHKIPSTLLGLHKKENRFPRAPFGACFVEKLTTEDWPGPVLASLNMSAKGYGQSRDQGVGQNLSVGQNRGQKMIIVGADTECCVWTSFQHPVQAAAAAVAALKEGSKASGRSSNPDEDLSTTWVHAPLTTSIHNCS